MPHKHKRKRENDKEHYDLPPSKIAKSLSAYEKTEKVQLKRGASRPKPKVNSKRKSDATSAYTSDDTPRAFARMMHLQQAGKRQRNGLDDGISKKPSKKKTVPRTTTTTTKSSTSGNKETDDDDIAEQKQVEDTASKLKIQPGERLSDFAARVNQALPLSGIAQNRKKVIGGASKERQTKTEKRLHKMYAEWREMDQKRKAAEEEFLERQEEKDEELQNELGGQEIHLPPSSAAAEGGKRRKKMLTELTTTSEKDDEDPWKVLEAKREKPKGLHDVVQAPPELKPVRERFKTKKTNGAKVDVDNVPGKSGSLARREELGQARKDVIERYRAMMKGKGGI